MANLAVYMNGYRVGTFTKTTSGAHQFQYHESWLAQPGSRPISLSMPLRHQAVNQHRKMTRVQRPKLTRVSWLISSSV